MRRASEMLNRFLIKLKEQCCTVEQNLTEISSGVVSTYISYTFLSGRLSQHLFEKCTICKRIKRIHSPLKFRYILINNETVFYQSNCKKTIKTSESPSHQRMSNIYREKDRQREKENYASMNVIPTIIALFQTKLSLLTQIL